MAIITLAEFKTYTSLYNSTTMSDAEISALIPLVEADYIKIQGKVFPEIIATTANTDDDITDVSDYDWLVLGLLVNGDSIRGTITVINETDDIVTLSAAATATTEDEEMTVYPVGSTYTAAKMIKHQFDLNGTDGFLKSESLEKHSVTWRDSKELLYGYPVTIIGSIKRYASVKTGTISYKGYDKGRRDLQTFCDGTEIDNGVDLNARNADGS